MSIGEISTGGIVLRGTIRQENVFRELSITEMSIGKKSVEETPVGELTRCHLNLVCCTFISASLSYVSNQIHIITRSSTKLSKVIKKSLNVQSNTLRSIV